MVKMIGDAIVSLLFEQAWWVRKLVGAVIGGALLGVGPMLSQMAKKPEITDSGKSSSKGDGSTFNFQGPSVNYFDLNRSKNADRDPDGLYQLGRKVGVVEY